MHNAPFDCGFINAELARANYPQTLADIATVTCTVQLARRAYPDQPNTLDALISRAGIEHTRQLHSALEDALLLAQIYTKLFATNTAQSADRYQNTATSTSRLAEPSMPAKEPNKVVLGDIIKSFIAKQEQKEATNIPASLIRPEHLGMEKVIEMISARQETFFYRDQHKRIIDHVVLNENRWNKIRGPLIYAVTDHQGIIRYVGKWVTATALQSRWLRHATIHHQEKARNIYIKELDEGRGPIAVWSISTAELKSRLPAIAQQMLDKDLAQALEALWINRWQKQLLWNSRPEPLTPGFDDGDFWQS